MKKIWGWIVLIVSIIGSVLMFVFGTRRNLMDEIDELADKRNKEMMEAEKIRAERLAKLEAQRRSNEKAVKNMSRDDVIDDILRNI